MRCFLRQFPPTLTGGSPHFPGAEAEASAGRGSPWLAPPTARRPLPAPLPRCDQPPARIPQLQQKVVPIPCLLTRLSRLWKILMLNFIALPRSAVLVNIVILHFLQVTLLLMFQLVTFIILLNEIFLYSSAPLTPMAAPRPLAGGRYEMNSSLIRNNNNKNTHAALRPLTSASLARRHLLSGPPVGPAAEAPSPPSRRCGSLQPATLPGSIPLAAWCLVAGRPAGWASSAALWSLFSLSGPLSLRLLQVLPLFWISSSA